MTLKPFPAGAGCPKSNHRSVANAVHATKGPKPGSAVPNTKKDEPKGQRVSAKRREVINNTNWRQRQRSTSSSTIDLAGPDTADPDFTRIWTSAGASSPSGESSRVEPDNVNNRKISVPDRQFNARRQSNSTSSGSYDDCDYRIERPNAGKESLILCTVLKEENLDVSLPDYQGPRIFEVAPHDSTQASSLTWPSDGSGHAPKLATLRCLADVPAKASERAPSSSDSYQPPPMYFTQKQGVEDDSFTWTTNHRKASQAPATGPEKPRSKPGRGTVNDDASFAAHEDTHKASLAAKNTAFQKMLEKLKKRASTSHPPPGEPLRTMRDSGYATGSGCDAALQEAPFGICDSRTLVRVPVSTRERRVKREFTASDSAMHKYRSNGPRRSQAESSDDSGIADVGMAKGHNLNPKAREFLSFVPGPEKAVEQRALRPLLLASDGNQDGIKGVLSDHDALNASQPGTCVAPFQPFPLIYNVVMPPFSLEPVGALGQHQMPQNPPWLGASSNVPSLAAKLAANCPPRLDNCLKGPQPTPSWFAGVSGLPQPAGPLSVPRMAGAGLHSLPARLHCPMAPTQMPPISAPAPHMGPHARPLPVPKPKLPNAGGQQAYEAYIEQRKAMEPGYALECRLRQQRRAKRTPNHAVTHLKSGSSSEA